MSEVSWSNLLTDRTTNNLFLFLFLWFFKKIKIRLINISVYNSLEWKEFRIVEGVNVNNMSLFWNLLLRMFIFHEKLLFRFVNVIKSGKRRKYSKFVNNVPPRILSSIEMKTLLHRLLFCLQRKYFFNKT